MPKTGAKMYLALHEKAKKDRAFRRLAKEYQQRDGAFLKVLSALPPKQRGAVMDYMGVCISMHYRLLELLAEDQSSTG